MSSSVRAEKKIGAEAGPKSVYRHYLIYIFALQRARDQHAERLYTRPAFSRFPKWLRVLELVETGRRGLRGVFSGALQKRMLPYGHSLKLSNDVRLVVEYWTRKSAIRESCVPPVTYMGDCRTTQSPTQQDN